MNLSTQDFVRALQALPQDKLESRRTILQKHYSSAGRASTATLLGLATGYEDHRGTNSSYGYLAHHLGKVLGFEIIDLDIICDVVAPERLTNREDILILKPEFAAALKQVGLVTD